MASLGSTSVWKNELKVAWSEQAGWQNPCVWNLCGREEGNGSSLVPHVSPLSPHQCSSRYLCTLDFGHIILTVVLNYVGHRRMSCRMSYV